ncbi:MAG: ATP-dependent zinc metalloprotease FtsH, partial [Longimicrobiales bacterium]
MADRDTKRSGPSTRWSRVSRLASFWVLLVLMLLFLRQVMMPQREDAPEITYSEMKRHLERDAIAEVTIDEREIEGTFRGAVAIDGREVTHFTTRLPFEGGDDLLQQLEAQGVAIEAAEPTQNWWAMLFSLLPWLLIIGFWLFFLRQMQSGGSKAFQFGKSKAKLLTGDTPRVNFADVAGADEAKEELQEIIEFLKDPQKFSRLGGRLPKGALLVGPPGTGKTLLAKAVAGEAARPFFSMSGSDFVEMFVGVGASRVRDLFDQGKTNAPCIIFIDEIDAVGRHRGAGLGGGHDEREQTLNQLLVEMDGFESNEGVILLAATNRPDVLDPALLRPGRFDRQIVVDAPDVKGREGILRVHLRKIPLAENVNVETLARSTPGMSGAELANLVNEAALLAARRNRDKVMQLDLEEAKDKVMLGAERKSMVLSEAERVLTAYHEAGHAVVALRTPGLDPLHKITIVPRGRALGVTASIPEEDRHSYSRDYLLARLDMLFGGRAAEELEFGPEKITTGAANDIERATSLARRMVTQFGMSESIGPMAVGDAEQEVFIGRELVQRREISEQTAQTVDSEIRRLCEQAYQRGKQVLEQNRELLKRIADSLLERETLDREEIYMLDRGEVLPERGPAEGAPGAPGTETAGPLVAAHATERSA